jgi:hypothetical protein
MLLKYDLIKTKARYLYIFHRNRPQIKEGVGVD